MKNAVLPDPADNQYYAFPLSIAVMKDYMAQWREEPEWPDCKSLVVLLMYDILLMCQASENLIREVLGNDSVEFICKILDTPTILTVTDIPPWQGYPGQSSHL